MTGKKANVSCGEPARVEVGKVLRYMRNMEDLFSQNLESMAPLARRLRPKTIAEFAGQKHLLGPGKFITRIFESTSLPSLLFWGPPGSGKTTLAFLLAQSKGLHFIPLSAVSAGVKELREVVATAKDQLKLYSRKTLLFLDEIHRFNKAEQDALLPHVEDGTLILMGATTENPSFEVISALLSRMKVVVLNRLDTDDLKKILGNAVTDRERGLGKAGLATNSVAVDFLCAAVDGDARRMLNTLETVSSFLKTGAEITVLDIESALQKRALPYDKGGEEHYNTISAFIKSMRDSDPSAAVYYLARLLEAGEDPLFVARRMVIFASEDVGNADPDAVALAVACMQSFDFVGTAEGWIPLAQCATYLASAPKSNASYMAYKLAKAEVEQSGSLPVPMHLRNAPAELMKKLGYGKGYKYAHNEEGRIAGQQNLPDKLKGRKYYLPTDIGHEQKIREWLDMVEKKKG